MIRGRWEMGETAKEMCEAWSEKERVEEECRAMRKTHTQLAEMLANG
jgi:hypothetical protein